MCTPTASRRADRLQRRANRKMAKEALWRACRAYDRRRMDETPVTELTDVRPRDLPRGAAPARVLGPPVAAPGRPARVPLAATHHAVGRASPASQHAVVAALGARGDLSAPEPLVLVGSGGFGRETAEVVRAINAAHAARTGRERWALLGFLDDDRERWGTEVSGTRVLGAIDDDRRAARRPARRLHGPSRQLRLQAADRRRASGSRPSATRRSCIPPPSSPTRARWAQAASSWPAS